MINQFDWAARWAAYAPDKVAFKEFESGRSLRYGELNRLGNRLAHRLTNHYGIRKGDRLAVLAENCLEFIVLFVAAQKTGCVLVPLNYRLAGPELEFLLQDSQPTILLVEAKFKEKIEGMDAAKSIPHSWEMEDLSRFLDAKLTRPEDQPFENARFEEDHPVFILYTSGTTGFPKGALYTHKMLFWNSINTALSLVVNSDSRTVNCMPPFHTGGWNVLTTPFFHHGGYTCLMKRFEPTAVLEAIQKEEATIFMGVPTMLKMLADLPEFEKARFPSLLYLIVGGEPMPLPLIEKWHGKGVMVRQGYGMTEVGPNLTSLHQRDAVRKMGSIGRPNFYVETRIVDEQGRECPPNAAGELLLRGPMVTPGYWRNEAATRQAFAGEWFRTGDRVLQDDEGFLYVVDRIKNMFISGGENVYPAEIERVLLEHPAVSEAAVVGVPDEKWGEVGKAFIVSKEPVTAETILEHCRQRLAGFKVPRYLVFLEALPKSATGKTDRQALKRWEG